MSDVSAFHEAFPDADGELSGEWTPVTGSFTFSDKWDTTRDWGLPVTPGDTYRMEATVRRVEPARTILIGPGGDPWPNPAAAAMRAAPPDGDEGWEARMAARSRWRDLTRAEREHGIPPPVPAPEDEACTDCCRWDYGPVGERHFGQAWRRTCGWDCDHACHADEVWIADA